MSDQLPIIVGAGPVGLAAALLLARQGARVRIIDQRPERTRHSKALAVNPRTLELLERTPVTQRMLELGMPIHGAQFHVHRQVVAQIDFSELNHRYPFMLALSQSTTERLLAEAAAELGVQVERQTRLVGCKIEDGIRVELENTVTTSRDIVNCPLILAADGAHSTVRSELGLAFDGSSYEREWWLVDVPLKASLAQDRVHIFFIDDGFMFMLRVVSGDADSSSDAPIWRVIANVTDPLAHLVDAEVTGEPVWTSSFHISHRMIEAMQLKSVFFAGDAAHVHSPAGARGMNLGIEDAWVFAELHKRGQTVDYHRLRYPVDLGVVRRVDRITRLMRGESAPTRFVRRALLPRMLSLPWVRRRMLETISGLDHPVAIKSESTAPR